VEEAGSGASAAVEEDSSVLTRLSDADDAESTLARDDDTDLVSFDDE